MAPTPAIGCLRVALVSDYYYPDLGGMPEHVHHLALELARRGHAVTVITTAFATPPPEPAAAPPPASAAPGWQEPEAQRAPEGATLWKEPATGRAAGGAAPWKEPATGRAAGGAAPWKEPATGRAAGGAAPWKEPATGRAAGGAGPTGGGPARGDSAASLPFEVVRLGRASGAIIANGSVSRAAVGLGLAAAMRRLLHERGFDLIHVHAPIFPTLALLAIRCAPPSARLVGTLHTHFEDSQLLRLLRRPLQRYLDALDGVIAVSDTALSCMRRLGFACEGEIIPNGVDLAYWQAGRALPDWRDGAVHLVAQARLEPRNHIGTIIEALRLLDERGDPGAPRLRLLVLGEGPQRQALATQGAGLPVHFAGAVLAARADFVATSDVYCFTAAIASHPMALLEGMAAGRPVLAHDIPGVRELVTDGVEGFVLPLGEPRAYAAALSRLAADRELRRRLGAAAQARVAAFSWPRIAARIETFYRALLER